MEVVQHAVEVAFLGLLWQQLHADVLLRSLTDPLKYSNTRVFRKLLLFSVEANVHPYFSSSLLFEDEHRSQVDFLEDDSFLSD